MADVPLEVRRRWPPLVDFQGRVGRLAYAAAAAIIGSAMPPMIDLLVLCARALGAPLPSQDVPTMLRLLDLHAAVALPLALVDGMAIVALALILLSFQVRRLHDFNLSGWFVLGFLPLQALPVPDLDPAPSLRFLLWTGLLVAIPGTVGPNAHGRDPKERTSMKQDAEADQA